MTAGKVLFIVLDQLRADCVHGALSGHVPLPSIARLRSEGTTFARHYTVTTPCGPARASLLTGQYAMNHRAVRNGTPLAAHHTNIAKEARRGGYVPLLFGYTDSSPDPRQLDPEDPALCNYEGLMPGFDEVTAMRLDNDTTFGAYLKARGYDLPDDPAELYRPSGAPGDVMAPALYRAEDSDTALLTNRTLEALDFQTGTDWFAHVTYIRPHPPLVAPAPFNRMFDPATLPNPDRTQENAATIARHPYYDAFFSEPSNTGLYFGYDGRMGAMDMARAKELRALYFGLTREVDDHLGRILDWLDATGQADDTLVILTADHGEMLGDHWQWGKESFHEGSLHIPLIIRDPRRPNRAGQVVEAFTESVDIAPTILDWIGQTAPAAMNGRSVLCFLDGTAPADWRTYAFAEIDIGNPVQATRFQRVMGLDETSANLAVLCDERFKLVHFNGGIAPLLFDLVQDPGEHRNCAQDPEMQDVLRRMMATMLDHRMRHADRTLSSMAVTPDGLKTAIPV